MKVQSCMIALLVLLTLTGCSNWPIGMPVVFPQPGPPVQITKDGKQHLLASYYGINSWSSDQRYITVLQTDIKNRLPNENDPAVLGLIDMKSYAFVPLTQTRAWNFQQGCMAHWLATSPDSLIIFNDLRDNRFVSVIMNIHTRKEIKIIPYPIAAVSPSGKEAVAINFSRLGYKNGSSLAAWKISPAGGIHRILAL